MDEEKALSDTAKALGLGPLLPALYSDLLSPAAKELGDGLATIARAVKISLAPVEAAVWGYERIREWLSIRVTGILAEKNVEKIQAPPLSVAGPLTLQMVFAADEPDLRDMYARLLATSMDCKSAQDAHPSFVTVIQQLSSDEAKLLRYIEFMDDEWPCWVARVGTPELATTMQKVCRDASVAYPEHADIYIDNLIRLRVLKYETFSESEFHAEGHNRHGNYSAYVSTQESEYIELTACGKKLLRHV